MGQRQHRPRTWDPRHALHAGGTQSRGALHEQERAQKGQQARSYGDHRASLSMQPRTRSWRGPERSARERFVTKPLQGATRQADSSAGGNPKGQQGRGAKNNPKSHVLFVSNTFPTYITQITRTAIDDALLGPQASRTRSAPGGSFRPEVRDRRPVGGRMWHRGGRHASGVRTIEIRARVIARHLGQCGIAAPTPTGACFQRARAAGRRGGRKWSSEGGVGWGIKHVPRKAPLEARGRLGDAAPASVPTSRAKEGGLVRDERASAAA